jgi:putative oxidoreductase
MDWRTRLYSTRAPGWSIFIRLLVGLVVFLPEGIQKLAFPQTPGAGRFAHIGIPYPQLTGPLVGVVAIVSTKVPILLGHDFWIFHLPKLPRYGWWSMLHEARADFDMLLGLVYLLIEGGGAWSLAARLTGRRPSAGG